MIPLRVAQLYAILALVTACASPQPERAALTIGGLSDAPTAETTPSAAPAPAAPDVDNPSDRRRAIQAYERYLADASKSPEHAEAMRRLADLRLLEAEYQTRESDGQSEHARAAIALYRELLRDYPDHANNDQVLYQLARAHDYAAAPDAALTALDRLVRHYPTSPLVTESHFRRAETLFTHRRYAEAADAYQAVLGFGSETLFYEQSLYKLGWALFRSNRHEDAIDAFMALLAHRAVDNRIAPERLERADRERAEDALRALALSFGYLDGAEAIDRYFETNGARDDEDVIYRRLAAEYLAHERYSDAATTFRAYVRRNPTAEHAPALQAAVVDSYKRGRFPSQMLIAKREYVELFELGGKFWEHRAPADHPDIVADLETNLHDLAEHYHAVYQRNEEDEPFQAAADWYRRYLHSFPDAARTRQMHFRFGELLTLHGDHAAAVEHFQRSAYGFEADEQAAEAGYAAVLAYQAHLEALPDEEQAEWERRALEHARRFAERFPAHEQASTVLGHALGRHLDRGEHEEIVLTAEQLLRDHSEAPPERHLEAWAALGHVYVAEGRYADAESAYRNALDLNVGERTERANLQDALAATIYRAAEQRREQGDATAVDEFLRVPQGRFRANAEFDAGTLLIRQREWERAAQVLENFRRNHPDHELTGQATRALAVAYHEAGAPLQAAAEFEKVGEQDPDDAIRREALLRAAELYRDQSHPERERSVLTEYTEHFSHPVGPALEAHARLAELYQQEGQQDVAQRQHRIIIAMQSDAAEAAGSRGRYLAARAALALADEAGTRFHSAQLTEPLERSLERKERLLREAREQYARASEYRIAPVTAAATYQSGELYRALAKALLASERPRELDEAALQEYELLLEELAYPFEERAIEIHEINVERARHGHFDRWIRASYDALAELMPARYAKEERHARVVAAQRPN